MTNKEIAHNLSQIAQILDLTGASKNRFRVIAYERAAETVGSMTEELSEIYHKGGRDAFDEIPGIGESIAQKIEELLNTNRLKYLQELKKEIPASEVDFLSIPGVGPKMAVTLTEELKAKNIEDLKTKIEKGVADAILKEKTRNNILRGIEVLGKLTGRLLITEALPIAEEVVAAIKKMPEVGEVEYVGSLRRYKETIGDIDIVATSKYPKKIIDQFVSLPFVDHIMTQGETKSTIIHWQGVQIDLEIVPEDEFGSLLQHFTGSKEHNVALRTYAQTKNKSVSEHGIKFQDKLHKFKTEKGVYNFLGLDYIPPELREDRGEVEAAKTGDLPKLIEIEDIKGDLHAHSKWSDGQMSIEELVSAAEKIGYEYISVSDHTVGLGIAGGLDEKELLERQLEIDKIQKKHPQIRILSAVEVNIKANGELDIKDEMLKKLDLVVASVHTSFHQSQEVMTERLLKAINNPNVDIIGHPSGRIMGTREPYEVDWAKIFDSCAKTKTALEISAFPSRLDLADFLVQAAKKNGVKFAIDTDSHHINHLQLMKYGVAVARRGWCERSDIINTKSLIDLMRWLSRS